MLMDKQELNYFIQNYLQSYLEKAPSVSDKEWLLNQLKKETLNFNEQDLEKFSDDLIGSIKSFSETLKSIEKNSAQRKDYATTWLENRIADANGINNYENVEVVDSALENATKRLLKNFKAEELHQSVDKSANELLAEQSVIDSFNAHNADSRFIAVVDETTDKSMYGRNAFDVAIIDKFTGRKLENYQVKYGDTITETIDMISKINNVGQQILVPQEQIEEVKQAFPTRQIVDKIGGTKLVDVVSSPITQNLVSDYLDGKLSKNISEIVNTDPQELVKRIANNAFTSGIITAGLNSGLEKIINQEPVEFKDREILEQALLHGDSEGIKIAVSGALATCVQKGLIKALPANTPAVVVSGLASAGIENLKILSQVAEGKITTKQAFEYMGNMNLAMAFEFAWGKFSNKVAAMALNFVPVVGPVVSKIIASGVLPIVSNRVRNLVYTGVKKVVPVVKSVVKSVYNKVKSFAKSVKETIFSFFR